MIFLLPHWIITLKKLFFFCNLSLNLNHQLRFQLENEALIINYDYIFNLKL